MTYDSSDLICFEFSCFQALFLGGFFNAFWGRIFSDLDCNILLTSGGVITTTKRKGVELLECRWLEVRITGQDQWVISPQGIPHL